MDDKTEPVKVQLDDGRVITFEATVRGRRKTSSVSETFKIAEVMGLIEGLAGTLERTTKVVKAQRASIEFGIQVAVESGHLTAWIVKGSANANLTFKIEWETSNESEQRTTAQFTPPLHSRDSP